MSHDVKLKAKPITTHMKGQMLHLNPKPTSLPGRPGGSPGIGVGQHQPAAGCPDLFVAGFC